MELIIHSPNKFVEEITFNNEEIKKELSLRLEKYQGITYNEEELKLAKTDRATLNKFKTALEDKRKEIKNSCLAPYNAFELKIKEIIALVDKPILMIDTQVKTFEETQKQDKILGIEEFFNENIGDLKDLVKLELFWKKSWLNSTCKFGTIMEEITNGIAKVKSDIEVIREFNSKFETEMINRYLTPGLFQDGLSMTEAMACKCRLDKKEKEIQELKDKQEKEKKAQEELKTAQKIARQQVVQKQEVIPPEVVANPLVVEEVTPVAETPPVDIKPELEMIDFRCWVTPEQKVILRNCIIDNKIKCGKVR